jgi:hypothetical protein
LAAVERVAERDIAHVLPDQLCAPAAHIIDIANQRGLQIEDRALTSPWAGELDIWEGTITVDLVALSSRANSDAQLRSLVAITVARGLGHSALHRWEWENGIHRPAQRAEARAYAAALLLPRPRLELDPELLQLQQLRQQRAVLTSELARTVQVVANRFGVLRTLVVERLLRLGFLERKPSGPVGVPCA